MLVVLHQNNYSVQVYRLLRRSLAMLILSKMPNDGIRRPTAASVAKEMGPTAAIVSTAASASASTADEAFKTTLQSPRPPGSRNTAWEDTSAIPMTKAAAVNQNDPGFQEIARVSNQPTSETVQPSIQSQTVEKTYPGQSREEEKIKSDRRRTVEKLKPIQPQEFEKAKTSRRQSTEKNKINQSLTAENDKGQFRKPDIFSKENEDSLKQAEATVRKQECVQQEHSKSTDHEQKHEKAIELTQEHAKEHAKAIEHAQEHVNVVENAQEHMKAVVHQSSSNKKADDGIEERLEQLCNAERNMQKRRDTKTEKENVTEDFNEAKQVSKINPQSITQTGGQIYRWRSQSAGKKKAKGDSVEDRLKRESITSERRRMNTQRRFTLKEQGRRESAVLNGEKGLEDTNDEIQQLRRETEKTIERKRGSLLKKQEHQRDMAILKTGQYRNKEVDNDLQRQTAYHFERRQSLQQKLHERHQSLASAKSPVKPMDDNLKKQSRSISERRMSIQKKMREKQQSVDEAKFNRFQVKLPSKTHIPKPNNKTFIHPLNSNSDLIGDNEEAEISRKRRHPLADELDEKNKKAKQKSKMCSIL